MRRLLPLIAAGAILLPVANARAITLQTSDTSQPWQAWADQSQAPTFAGAVPLTTAAADSACGDDAGCTSIYPQVDQTTGQILPGRAASVTIQIATGDPADMERGYLYHELGHVFDAEYMTDPARAQFMSIYGLTGGWWTTHTTIRYGVTITYTPGEWFAEAYRMCATWGIYQPQVNTYEDYGYPGDRPAFTAQQRQACELINQIGLANAIVTPAQAPPHFTGRVISVRLRTIRRMRQPAHTGAYYSLSSYQKKP